MNEYAMKLQRILYNYFQKNRTAPPVAWLIRQSGKNRKELTSHINELAAAGYLEWDGEHLQSVLLKRLPDQVVSKKSTSSESGNDYFTLH